MPTLPVRREARTRFEIAHAERLDERQAAQRGVFVTLDMGAVRDHGTEAGGEDVPEIRDKARGGVPPGVHAFILEWSRCTCAS